jgi:hypothetical protein
VLRFDSIHDCLSDDEGNLIFATAAPLRVLAASLVDAAATIIKEHGTAGYHELWATHPFPSDALRQLQELVA